MLISPFYLKFIWHKYMKVNIVMNLTSACVVRRRLSYKYEWRGLQNRTYYGSIKWKHQTCLSNLDGIILNQQPNFPFSPVVDSI